jgi:hypothetical protein
MRTQLLVLAFSIGAIGLLPACAHHEGSCNHVGCGNSAGLDVVFSAPLREPGTYEFELELDGAGTSVCSYTLMPESKAGDEAPCTHGSLSVGLELAAEREPGIAVLDSMTPVTGIRSIGTSSSGAPLMVRIKRNGVLLVEQDSLPVTEVNMHPNACEPCLGRVVNLSVP